MRGTQKGYRLIAAAALVGLVIWCLTLGYVTAASNYPVTERWPLYRYAQSAEGAADADKSLPTAYREPCRDPVGKEGSDLCAQWRAARGSENSAFWAQLSFWVSSISAVAIGLALLLTIDSNRIARRIGEAQVRCYLSIPKIEIDYDDLLYPGIALTIRNSGQSTARDVNWSFQATINGPKNISITSPQVLNDPLMEYGRDISAGGKSRLKIRRIESQPSYEFGEILAAKHVSIHVIVILTWSDVFQKRFREVHRFSRYEDNFGSKKEMRLFPDLRPVERSETSFE